MANPAIIFPNAGTTYGDDDSDTAAEYTYERVGFQWHENDVAVTNWGLDVSEVAAGGSDLYSVRNLPAYQTGVSVGSMPTSGTVYVRLFWSTDNGATYSSADTTFTAGADQPAYKTALRFDWYEQGRWYQCERCGFLFHEEDTAIDPRSGLRVCTIGPSDLDEDEFGIFEVPVTSRREPKYRREQG